MRIKCFGIARDIVDSSEIQVLDKDVNTVSKLRQKINELYPQFDKYKSYMIAINQTYAEDTDTITSDDEIAIIPPVSGG